MLLTHWRWEQRNARSSGQEEAGKWGGNVTGQSSTEGHIPFLARLNTFRWGNIIFKEQLRYHLPLSHLFPKKWSSLRRFQWNSHLPQVLHDEVTHECQEIQRWASYMDLQMLAHLPQCSNIPGFISSSTTTHVALRSQSVSGAQFLCLSSTHRASYLLGLVGLN